LELLGYCREEVQAMAEKLRQVREHLKADQNLAAQGVFRGVEDQIAFIDATLKLMARML